MQRFEVGNAGRQHEGDLAVDQRILARQSFQCRRDRREAHCPVEPAATEQSGLVPGFAPEDAITVIFDFVQPSRPGRHMGVERGELRLDEFGRYRAARLRRLFAVPAEAFAFGFGFGVFF